MSEPASPSASADDIGLGAGPAGDAVAELAAAMAVLRAPDGCVWNRGMTHRTLVPYLLEESHELVEAIETDDVPGMREELADVLLQVVFHADIARTEGEGFDLADVARTATDKMVRRHPHVFGDERADTVEEVLRVWGAAKDREKSARTSVVDGIPMGMPSLALADKLLGRAERVSLLEADAPAAIPVDDEDDLGRLLLAVVVSARSRGLDAERALRTTLRSLTAEIQAAEIPAEGRAPGDGGIHDGADGGDASPGAGRSA
ncbi:MazG family protein [Clavibacter nebraskensis]|uniref:Nucleoside triphosphate pyrophosphohydrolase n=1 Tax=Clavibacter nebraskensis TaxID=31963 RepID=A0A399Q8E6_9MICO|nr:MazG family protein [Clavibacter nebraskensis]RIJ15188.1 nucleoside triphosphate pyrophosphohydrolase [Clavibacter nebraskensis]UKF29065.1 MazG family protein [Clavibacter nebraskensis]UQB12893.1 MazG family protein [Clavibacter nebraskensis]UQB15729.1 MazG family protein [Clavibacter nebraskensis]